jgi:hypothetical protein
LRGLGSEDYLRVLWENLIAADASIGDGGQGYISDVDAEEIGTGGRADVYDLLDSGAVDAGDQPKWLDSIHDYVFQAGDDE